jgi:hypothetical protein
MDFEDFKDDWVPNSSKLLKTQLKADDSTLMNSLKDEQDLPELYDPVQDLKYEQWAVHQYGNSKSPLSCPKCFTCISSNSVVEGTSHLSKKTFNTSIGEKVLKSEFESFLSVTCEVCGCMLGVMDPDSHIFHLFHVLEGNS